MLKRLPASAPCHHLSRSSSANMLRQFSASSPSDTSSSISLPVSPRGKLVERLQGVFEAREDTDNEDRGSIGSIVSTPQLLQINLSSSVAEDFKILRAEAKSILSSDIELKHLPFLGEMPEGPLPPTSLNELLAQFHELEQLEVFFENPENLQPMQHKRAEFERLRIAIQAYQLAIMEAVSLSLRPEATALSEVQNQSWLNQAIRVSLYAGGTWIAALEAYDAVTGTISLIAGSAAVPIWLGIVLTLPVFLVTAGIFISFEANELDEHLGFHSTPGYSSKHTPKMLYLNQRKLEVTNEFCKKLSQTASQLDINTYTTYSKFAEKFSDAVGRVNQRVEGFKVKPTTKALQGALVFFGMVYASSEALFLVGACLGIGFLLSGPIGLAILSVTALLGAAIFYYSLNNMIRNKVAPGLKAKDEFLEGHKKFTNEHWIESILSQKKEKEKLLEGEKELNKVKDRMEKAKDILRQAQVERSGEKPGKKTLSESSGSIYPSPDSKEEQFPVNKGDKKNKHGLTIKTARKECTNNDNLSSSFPGVSLKCPVPNKPLPTTDTPIISSKLFTARDFVSSGPPENHKTRLLSP